MLVVADRQCKLNWFVSLNPCFLERNAHHFAFLFCSQTQFGSKIKPSHSDQSLSSTIFLVLPLCIASAVMSMMASKTRPPPKADNEMYDENGDICSWKLATPKQTSLLKTLVEGGHLTGMTTQEVKNKYNMSLVLATRSATLSEHSRSTLPRRKKVSLIYFHLLIVC